MPYETVLRLPDPRAQSLNLLHECRGWLWFDAIHRPMIGAPNDAPTPTIPRHFCALLVVSIYPTPLLLLPLSREEAFLRVFSEWPLRARLLVVAFQQRGFEHVRLYGFAKVVCACALTLQPPLSLLFSMKVFLHVLLSSCLRVLVSFVSS